MPTQPPHDEGNPRIDIDTIMGGIACEIFPREAPTSTANFTRYVREGFFDGLIFHRVIKGFMIQGGGILPNGRPKRATYQPIPLETTKALFHWDGALAMARTADLHSATTQFYICDGPQPSLDGKYAVFGIAVAGMDVVRRIAAARTDPSDRPLQDINIKSIKLHGSP